MATLSAVNSYESSQTILLQSEASKRNILILRSPKTPSTNVLEQAVNLNILQHQQINLDHCKRNILVLRNKVDDWDASNPNILLQSSNLESTKSIVRLGSKDDEYWDVSPSYLQQETNLIQTNLDTKVTSRQEYLLQETNALEAKITSPTQSGVNNPTNLSRKKVKLSSGKEMTRVHNPPPVAVARRNARERNRVKQVNNGFATLRQHIPTAIASNYESGNSRSGNKKLSKVETLRMAVDYIRSLEKLLEITEDSEACPSSQIYYEMQSKKKYYFEDEENIHPSMEDIDEELLDSNLTTNLQLTDSTFSSIDHHASLSPEVYSEHSLSPSHLSNDSKSFIPVFNLPNHQSLPAFTNVSYERLTQVKSELLSPTPTSVEEQNDLIVNAELINNQSNIINAIWWGQSRS